MFPEIFLLVDRLDSFLHRLRLRVDDWHFQEWIEFPEVFLAEHVRPTTCRHGDEEHSPRYMVWWCVLEFTFVVCLCCLSDCYSASDHVIIEILHLQGFFSRVLISYKWRVLRSYLKNFWLIFQDRYYLTGRIWMIWKEVRPVNMSLYWENTAALKITFSEGLS
jgi:hypothetical protein